MSVATDKCSGKRVSIRRRPFKGILEVGKRILDLCKSSKHCNAAGNDAKTRSASTILNRDAIQEHGYYLENREYIDQAEGYPRRQSNAWQFQSLSAPRHRKREVIRGDFLLPIVMTTTPKATMVCDEDVTGMSKAANEYWAKIIAFPALKLRFPAVSTCLS